MRKLMITMVLPVLAALANTARADGLLYQLPEDKAWVQFDLEFTIQREGNEQTSKGSLTMKSVGKTTEGADACRWLEFHMKFEENGQQRTVVAKVLIPEKYLKKGESPMEHVVRGWLKDPDSDPVALQESNYGPLPAFLASPLQDAQKLDKEVVESKLGKLECEGVMGYIQFKEGEIENTVTYQTRRHEKAPFGVVSTAMKFEIKRDGQIRQNIQATLKLADFGTDAESELPGYQ